RGAPLRNTLSPPNAAFLTPSAKKTSSTEHFRWNFGIGEVFLSATTAERIFRWGRGCGLAAYSRRAVGRDAGDRLHQQRVAPDVGAMGAAYRRRRLCREQECPD